MDFLIENSLSESSPIVLIEAKASEKVANKKLNFSKISPLFKKRPVQCLLMSNISQAVSLKMKNYRVSNPVYCDIKISGSF